MSKTVSRRAFALVSLAALTGCGFRPVYMPTASGKPGVAQRELAAVFVGVIPDRPGQQLRQALQERLGDDSGTNHKYYLNVAFGVTGEAVGIEQNNIATRVRLTGLATWTLRDRDAFGPVLTSGSARAADALNIFDAQYFAADQETEAEEARMAESLATEISMQLAVWFNKRAAGEPQAGHAAS